MNKLFILLIGMFLLVSAPMVSAGNYLFENTSGAELMKIYGENGALLSVPLIAECYGNASILNDQGGRN